MLSPPFPCQSKRGDYANPFKRQSDLLLNQAGAHLSDRGPAHLPAKKVTSTAFIVPTGPVKTQTVAESGGLSQQHSKPARPVKNPSTLNDTYHLVHLVWCWPMIWQQELLLEEQEQQVLAVSAARLAVWN